MRETTIRGEKSVRRPSKIAELVSLLDEIDFEQARTRKTFDNYNSNINRRSDGESVVNRNFNKETAKAQTRDVSGFNRDSESSSASETKSTGNRKQIDYNL